MARVPPESEEPDDRDASSHGAPDSSGAQGTHPFAALSRSVVVSHVTTVRPCAAPLVRVIGAGSTVRGGGNGGFALTDASAGTQTFEARMIGYTPLRRTAQVSSGGTDEIALVLPVQRVQLDTVRVAASRPISAEIRRIEARARSGLGRPFSGDVIHERSSLFGTDILRGMNGLIVTNGTLVL